jgi:class 3 adenylate cyclase/tetratricopeptide (TPR) repeat protein
MQCSSCGTENSPKAKFCGECGAPLGAPCPDCGARNPRDAPACSGCGRTLGAPRKPVAARRQITVLFADIVGSTALAETLDPEDLRDLYARYQTLCAEVVQRYEGHLAQYLGDGVLAYFGYPSAHEDDAARAVRSGLEILQRAGVASVNAKRPQVRVGVHTGLVVVGEVGGGSRHEELALGETPNIAARLQSEAQPDTLVISEATAKLLAGQFALENLGPRTLKGISRPIAIFRVLGRSGAASRFQAMKTAHGLTPFVGREREVEIIRAACAEAAAGSGRTLLLCGEAGMGKSRLLEAARQAAAARQYQILETQCSPYQMNSPLFPVVEMLERRMGIDKDMAAAEKLDRIEQFAANRANAVEHAAQALADVLSVPAAGRYPEIEMAPARRRQWIIEILAALLLHSVDGSPVLFLTEDLHWADPSTLDLLSEMVARQAGLPALLVCSARPGFAAPWRDRPHYREIRVEALSAEETRALVARIAGPKPLPIAVREQVVARTGGVPLFVEAVTRTVMEAGILRELEDRYELTGPLPAGLIPATVQDSLMGRIDRLGVDRPVAQLAATIGRESSFELLQAVLDVPTAELARALSHLVELELVSESGVPPASSYTFKHALIQDAAYESLLRKTRQEFHHKIANVLVHRFPELAETKPELLARHFEGAGRTAEAIAAWMKAGLQAGQRVALRECAAHMQKTISLLQTLPEDDPDRLRTEMEAQLTLGLALTAIYGWAARELETACSRARDLSKRLGNTVGMLQATFTLVGTYLVRGAIPKSLETAESMLDDVLTIGDPLLEIIARHSVSFATFFLADFVRTRRHAEKGFELYTRERERALAALQHVPSSFACGHILGLSLYFLGYPEQAEETRRKALAIIEELNIPACTAYALGCTLDFHYLRRDLAAIRRVADQTYALSSEDGYVFWVAHARIFQAWIAAMTGDADRGIAKMHAALESYRLTGSGFQMPKFSLMMAEAQLQAGRPGDALAALSRGLQHADECQEYVYQPELHRLRGEIHFRQGNAAGAEASLICALELARRQQAKTLELRAAVPLAKLYCDQGRIAEARALLQPLDEWFQEGRNLPELREAGGILQSLGRAAEGSS